MGQRPRQARCPRTLLAALLAGLGGSLFSAGAAQAQPSTLCNFTGGLITDCTWNGAPHDPLLPFYLADKQFSALSWTVETGDPTGTIAFTQVANTPGLQDDLWTVDVDFGGENDGVTAPAKGVFSYRIDILDSLGGAAWQFDTALNDSDVLNPDTLVTMDLQVSGGNLSLPSANGNNIGVVPIGGKFAVVANTWEATTTNGRAAELDSFTNTFTQQTEVPGPLPLLGAGAAFGFSRRLRSRIRRSTVRPGAAA